MTEDGRITIRELADQIEMSSLSVTDRILKLKDAGAITGYTVLVDPKASGIGVAAYLRLRSMPGDAKKWRNCSTRRLRLSKRIA